MRELLLPGLLSVTLLNGCSLLNGEEDVVKISPLPTVEDRFTPATAWSTSVGSGIGSFYSNLHPALTDSVVYAADRAGSVKALNTGDDKEIWSVNLTEEDDWLSKDPALLPGGVTVSGGYVYIDTEKAQAYMLSTNDGIVAWQTKVADKTLSRPVVSDGLALTHTSNGQLQALNEANSAVEWTASLDMSSLSLRGESAPATALGTTVVGGDNSRASAVLMKQDQMVWRQRISQTAGSTEIDCLSDVGTTPVVVSGVVFALAYNGNLTALDLRSSQTIWKRELGSVNDFIVDDSHIYLVDQNDRVMALTIDGGVTLWTQSDLLHRLLASPVLHNGNLMVDDSEGYLHWINIEDGRFIAQQEVGSSGFQTKPIAADSKLLVQAKDGTVYSIIH